MSDSDFDSGESELPENFSDAETSDLEQALGAAVELHGSPHTKKQNRKANDGDDDDNNDESGVRQPNKRHPKKREKLGEEVRALADFESDVATLQIKEILKEITLKEKKRQALLAWFSQLKALLLATGQVGKKQQQGRRRQGHGHGRQGRGRLATNGSLPKATIPFKLADDETHFDSNDFVFRPPKSVRLVGSFAYDTAVKWSAVDIAVEMPKECFAKWDYHNLKYHRKRAQYLVHLAAAVQDAPSLYSKLQWYVNGDYRLPALLLTSADGLFSAYILPFPEENFFAKSRFAADKLNIQEKFIGMPIDSRKPVPIHNGGVLEGMLLASTAASLSEQLSGSAGIRAGIQLLKLWLRTRGLCEGPDGFSSFLLTIYASHLLKSERLSPTMGAYQVVRAVLAQIQADDWRTTPTTTTTTGSGVLLDDSACHNYFYRLSTSCRRLLKEEARAALHSMNSGSVTLINDLFSTRVPFYRKLDCYARIFLGGSSGNCGGGGGGGQKQQLAENRLDAWTRADFGPSLLWPTAEAILATLRRAFGRRVTLLASKPLESVQWDVACDEIPREPTEFDIGWNLNPDEAHHHIDKGPPADSAAADEFRSFWGEKCEIRRFQDGSILETVVWSCDDDDDDNDNADESGGGGGGSSRRGAWGKQLTQHICEYILTRQHDVARISFAGELCDRVLELPRCRFARRYGIGHDQLIEVNTKFGEFARLLRSLKDLPLAITGVQGLSEEIAYTAVFPQAAAACDTDARLITRVNGRCVPKADQAVPKLVRPVDILLVMESSSKWPDELAAIRHIKTAFYFALATKLEARECQVFPEHLLVLFQGIVFRLRVSCPKEVILSRQVTTPDGMVRLVESRDTEQLEFEQSVLPQLVSALHGLQLQQPTFGTASRLAKRWLSCHLLYDAFPPLAVDLVVASLYLSPLPFAGPPHSARAAFQRFLHMLSTFDWRLNPLVVNVNNHYSAHDVQQIGSYFTRNRQSLPAMYIRTPFDKGPKSFITSEGPIGLALHRASRLAGKCLSVLEVSMADGQSSAVVGGVFHTSLAVYDFVIRLEPRSVATSHLALDSREKLSFTKTRDEIPVVDFDPVSMYVAELKSAFGHLCLLFYDGYGGTDIGGLWIPKAQAPLRFNAHNANARKLVEPAMVLVPDYNAIFADFKRLGQGLVREVVEQRCPNNYSQQPARGSGQTLGKRKIPHRKM